MSGPNTVSTSRDSQRAPVSVCVSVWQVCLGCMCMKKKGAHANVCVLLWFCFSGLCGLYRVLRSNRIFSSCRLFFPAAPSCPSLSLSIPLSLNPPIVSLSLCLSLGPLLLTAPVGLLWVYLSCFPHTHPMQFSLYQHLISTEWVVLCTERAKRDRVRVKKKRKKNARRAFI